MPEPLRNRYSRAYVDRLASAVASAWPRFDRGFFLAAAMGDGWHALELKQRMRRLSSTLHRFLPLPYPEQLELLRRVAPRFGGFEAMLFPDFVEQFGLDHFDASTAALEWFTQFSSSEFAVRPFILRHGPRMMTVMCGWTTHANEHVRRLASEGCRPRLPWAMALPAFKKDPSPILPILERLKADPSPYVRRSVANNLNDIAKDHPDLVLSIATRWLGQAKATDTLVKHACRTLLKRGDPKSLALFGFAQSRDIEVRNLRVDPKTLRIGGTVHLHFAVHQRSGKPQRVRIEFAVEFVRSRGSRHRKVFHIAETTLASGRPLRFRRAIAFRDLSTRRHYPGPHAIAVLVNGVPMAGVTVNLLDR